MTEENVTEKTDDVIEVEPEKIDEGSTVLVTGDGENKDKLVEALEKADGVKEVIQEDTPETNPEDKEQIVKKKEVILPPIGTKFMIAGESYKVTWLNPGKHRFSAEPCEGQY